MATEAQLERKKEKLHKALAAQRGGVGEPIVTKENYKVDLMLALNWYNANEESSKLTKFGIEYLKKSKKDEYIKYFNLASDFETNQLATLMRLVVREQYLADEHKALIDSRLATIKAKYTDKLAEKIEEKKVAEASGIVTLSVLDRVTEVARKHMAEIDYEIDKFVQNKSSDFSLKSYIAKNGLSSAVTKKIAEFYKPLLKELTEVLEGNDEDLNEGYSFLSKAQIKKFQAFVESIVSDSEYQVLAAKANRMPRKRKEKPAGIQVAKMQYLAEFPELGLTSIHPTKIVGANQLWTYNTKNKKLGVYYATGSTGFSVKGTSIQGWDPEVSAQNGLRKPAATIAEVMFGGKMQLAKILGKLTTITTKMNGRINSDTILLRVL
jgi:hypothetical protein